MLKHDMLTTKYHTRIGKKLAGLEKRQSVGFVAEALLCKSHSQYSGIAACAGFGSVYKKHALNHV